MKRLLRFFPRKHIEHQDGRSYLTRYFVLFEKRPSWFPFNVFIHRFHSSDDDRALHDHPWAWASLILSGGYWEHTPTGRKWKKPGSFRLGRATDLHRLELDPKARPTWTVFIVGVRKREWGFVKNGQWIGFRQFLGLPDDLPHSGT